jgi:hypothetical protein
MEFVLLLTLLLLPMLLLFCTPAHFCFAARLVNKFWKYGKKYGKSTD